MFVFLEPQAPFKWECLQEAYGSRKRNVFSDANVLFPSSCTCKSGLEMVPISRTTGFLSTFFHASPVWNL